MRAALVALAALLGVASAWGDYPTCAGTVCAAASSCFTITGSPVDCSHQNALCCLVGDSEIISSVAFCKEFQSSCGLLFGLGASTTSSYPTCSGTACSEAVGDLCWSSSTLTVVPCAGATSDVVCCPNGNGFNVNPTSLTITCSAEQSCAASTTAASAAASSSSYLACQGSQCSTAALCWDLSTMQPTPCSTPTPTTVCCPHNNGFNVDPTAQTISCSSAQTCDASASPTSAVSSSKSGFPTCSSSECVGAVMCLDKDTLEGSNCGSINANTVCCPYTNGWTIDPATRSVFCSAQQTCSSTSVAAGSASASASASSSSVYSPCTGTDCTTAPLCWDQATLTLVSCKDLPASGVCCPHNNGFNIDPATSTITCSSLQTCPSATTSASASRGAAVGSFRHIWPYYGDSKRLGPSNDGASSYAYPVCTASDCATAPLCWDVSTFTVTPCTMGRTSTVCCPNGNGFNLDPVSGTITCAAAQSCSSTAILFSGSASASATESNDDDYPAYGEASTSYAPCSGAQCATAPLCWDETTLMMIGCSSTASTTVCCPHYNGFNVNPTQRTISCSSPQTCPTVSTATGAVTRPAVFFDNQTAILATAGSATGYPTCSGSDCSGAIMCLDPTTLQGSNCATITTSTVCCPVNNGWTIDAVTHAVYCSSLQSCPSANGGASGSAQSNSNYNPGSSTTSTNSGSGSGSSSTASSTAVVVGSALGGIILVAFVVFVALGSRKRSVTLIPTHVQEPLMENESRSDTE